MKQELIDTLDELRKLAHQLAHTFTLEITHDSMDAEQWGNLQDGLRIINSKSQDAFLISANLRRGIK